MRTSAALPILVCGFLALAPVCAPAYELGDVTQIESPAPTPAAAWRHLRIALNELDAAVAMAAAADPRATPGTRAEVALAEGIGDGLHDEARRLFAARSHGQLEPSPERVMATVWRLWGVIARLANLAAGPAPGAA